MISSRACLFASLGLSLFSAACSSSNASSPVGPNAGGAGGTDASVADATIDAGSSADGTVASNDSAANASSAGTSQAPPIGGAAVEAWLATGAYKLWSAEPAIHASRSPSPHGFNRIYSNQIISSNAGGTGPWPEGAAAVKELYNAQTDTTPVGYAVYLKTQSDSAAGANWYWYERVPSTSSAPHDAAGVVADGLGGSGTPNTICVGCHAAAGSDPAHTPSPGGRDEVYTPVSSSGSTDAGAADASAASGPSDAGAAGAADAASSGTEAGATDAALAGTSQTPPMGGPNVEAWLATGAYKQWAAEPAIHASRSPSPHGFNRIYSNQVISSNAAGTGPWPEGAAAVKELYNLQTDTVPVGYAVYLKTQADSAAGANWYWYERVPSTSSAPHDANGVVADGLGGSGTPNTICVACHSAAESDAAHTPSVGGRDEVYTPVP